MMPCRRMKTEIETAIRQRMMNSPKKSCKLKTKNYDRDQDDFYKMIKILILLVLFWPLFLSVIITLFSPK